MPTPVQTILRNATRKDSEPLNIMTFCTHERYETGLAKTGHRFYAWQGENIKTWNSTYAPIPENYHILDKRKEDRQLPIWADIDLVLSQNKFGQYAVASKLAQHLKCPLVTLEHTLPTKDLPRHVKMQIAAMGGDLDVFISEYSIEEWGWKKDNPKVRVIRHAVDTELFKPDFEKQEDLVCSVVNDWINRDWCCGFKLWQETIGWPNSRLPLNVWGDTPRLSVAAKGVDALVKEYQRSKIFLNTSLISPVPTVLLEAMASGCAVVSTNTCMIPEFIAHGENGFMADNAVDLRSYVDLLRKDDSLARKMGEAARKTIVEKFSLDRFTNEWNKVFEDATR